MKDSMTVKARVMSSDSPVRHPQRSCTGAGKGRREHGVSQFPVFGIVASTMVQWFAPIEHRGSQLSSRVPGYTASTPRCLLYSRIGRGAVVVCHALTEFESGTFESVYSSQRPPAPARSCSQTLVRAENHRLQSVPGSVAAPRFPLL